MKGLGKPVVWHKTSIQSENPVHASGNLSRRKTRLAVPSNHMPELISPALELLRGIFQPGHFYKKTGIFLTDLIGEREWQPDLFENRASSARNRRIDGVLDGLNPQAGPQRDPLRLDGCGYEMADAAGEPFKKFTKRWDELPEAKA